MGLKSSSKNYNSVILYSPSCYSKPVYDLGDDYHVACMIHCNCQILFKTPLFKNYLCVCEAVTENVVLLNSKEKVTPSIRS